MNRLFYFLKQIDPSFDKEQVINELEIIDRNLINDDFFDAIEFCMLKCYSFKDTIKMIIAVNFNYGYLKSALNFIQNQKPILPIDWDKLISNFPREKRLCKIFFNRIEYYYYCCKQYFGYCL